PETGLLLFGLGIKLGEPHTWFEFTCGLFKDWREAATRSTPWRPAVDQHGNCRVLQHLIDIPTGQRDRLAGEQGILAATTTRAILQTIGRNSIGDIAERTSKSGQAHRGAPDMLVPII